MQSDDEFFGRLRGDVDAKLHNKQRRDASVEAQAVKHILDYGKVPMTRQKIAADTKHLYGESEITFRWLSEKFPRFPVRLLAAKIDWMQNTTMSSLFGQPFMRTKFMTEYRKQLSEWGLDPSQHVVGLVFNCPRAVGATFMVVHNRSVDLLSDLPNGATRIVHAQGSPRQIYVVEGLKDFVTGLGIEWTNDGA